jgi:hypothetical protein
MRNYQKEYKEYQGTPEQIKHREERNAARRLMIKEGHAHKGDGKDVGHIHGLKHGNVSSNLDMETKHYNRGWRRGEKGYKPVS